MFAETLSVPPRNVSLAAEQVTTQKVVPVSPAEVLESVNEVLRQDQGTLE